MAKVAILGCGPAGLLAAHAAVLSGHTVSIFSKKQISPMQGAQYMHVEIPGIKLPEPEIIHYVLWGKEDNYRSKVYHSRDPDLIVSPQQYMGDHKCWDLRATYSMLWHHWNAKILDVLITQQALEKLSQNYDYIFSTIPAIALCKQYLPGEQGSHEFDYVSVWIDNMWSGPTPAESSSIWGNGNHLVICNGLTVSRSRLKETGWYRTSHIYHHTNTEWADETYIPENRVSIAGRIWRVRKPLQTDCSCWPNIIRVGRYGLWQKGVLTHHAFEQVIKTLS